MHATCACLPPNRFRQLAFASAFLWFTLAGLLPANASLSDRIAIWTSSTLDASLQELHSSETELSTLPPLPSNESTPQIGWHSSFAPLSGSASRFAQVDLGASESFDAIALVPVTLSEGGQEHPGYGFPIRFRVESSETPDFAMPAVCADFTQSDFPNPGRLPVVIETPSGRGRFVRVTATRLYTGNSRSFFALGEILVLRAETNLAAARPVSVSDTASNPPAWSPSNLTDGQHSLGSPVAAEHSPGNGYHSAIEPTSNSPKWVQLDLGKEQPIEEVRLFAAAPVDFPARLGFGFPKRFRIEIGNQPDLSDGVPLTNAEKDDFGNPGANPIGFSAGNQRARFVRVTATQLWQRHNDFVFALSELQVFSEGINVAPKGIVTSLDRVITGSWNPKFLNDGYTSQGRIVHLGEWLRGLSRRRELQEKIATLDKDTQKLKVTIQNRLQLGTLGFLLLSATGVTFWFFRQRWLRQREIHALRQRLSSDLHDEIGSNLGSITLLSRLASTSARSGLDTQEDLLEIHRIAQDTADSVRDIVWLLQPGPRTASALLLRLRETAGQLLKGTPTHFETSKVVGPFSLEAERQILLIFKEALNNIRKHAQATEVAISIHQNGPHFQMTIQDNGIGFAPDQSSSGLGLTGLRTRAEQLGGTLIISSPEGKGTRLELKLALL